MGGFKRWQFFDKKDKEIAMCPEGPALLKCDPLCVLVSGGGKESLIGGPCNMGKVTSGPRAEPQPSKVTSAPQSSKVTWAPQSSKVSKLCKNDEHIEPQSYTVTGFEDESESSVMAINVNGKYEWERCAEGDTSLFVNRQSDLRMQFESKSKNWIIKSKHETIASLGDIHSERADFRVLYLEKKTKTLGVAVGRPKAPPRIVDTNEFIDEIPDLGECVECDCATAAQCVSLHGSEAMRELNGEYKFAKCSKHETSIYSKRTNSGNEIFLHFTNKQGWTLTPNFDEDQGFAWCPRANLKKCTKNQWRVEQHGAGDRTAQILEYNFAVSDCKKKKKEEKQKEKKKSEKEKKKSEKEKTTSDEEKTTSDNGRKDIMEELEDIMEDTLEAVEDGSGPGDDDGQPSMNGDEVDEKIDEKKKLSAFGKLKAFASKIKNQIQEEELEDGSGPGDDDRQPSMNGDGLGDEPLLTDSEEQELATLKEKHNAENDLLLAKLRADKAMKKAMDAQKDVDAKLANVHPFAKSRAVYPKQDPPQAQHPQKIVLLDKLTGQVLNAERVLQ